MDWIRLWWEYFGKTREMFVIVFFEEDEVLGFCPFMISKKKLYREISFIGYGNGTTTYMDFILKRRYREDIIDKVVEILLELKGPVIINLSRMFENNPNYIYIKERINQKKIIQITNHMVNYFYHKKNNDFKSYYKERFGSNSRQTTRRKERKLQILGDLNYGKAFKKELEEIFRVHEKRWLRKIGNSSFSKGREKEFFMRLTTEVELPFKTVIKVLRLNNKVISFIYEFKYKEVYFFKRIAHDDNFSKFSPGAILVKKRMKEFFENQEGTFGFGIGEELYKRDWTDTYIKVMSLMVSNKNIFSNILLYIMLIKKKVRETLKKSEKIVRFRKVRLAKFKFLLSKENLSWKYQNLRTMISRKGYKYLIKECVKKTTAKLYYKKEVQILEKEIDEQNNFIEKENYNIKQLTIEDLELLSKIINIHPSIIINRLSKKEKCYLFEYKGQLIQYAWVSFSNIKIPEIGYKENIKSGDAFIYKVNNIDYRSNYKDNQYIISYILNELYNTNCKRCFIVTNKKDKKLDNNVSKDIFSPKRTIKAYKLLCKKDIKIYDSN